MDDKAFGRKTRPRRQDWWSRPPPGAAEPAPFGGDPVSSDRGRDLAQTTSNRKGSRPWHQRKRPTGTALI